MKQYITHVADGLGKLDSWLQNQPNTTAFLGACLRQVQAVDDALYALWFFGPLGNAYGSVLDQWGSVLALARGGLADDIYKLRLQVQQIIDRGYANTEEMITILAILCPGSTIRYQAAYPAGQVLSVNGVAVTNGDALFDVLQSAKAGGVRTQLHWSSAAAADTFWTLGGPGKGFRALTSPPGTGGILSRLKG